MARDYLNAAFTPARRQSQMANPYRDVAAPRQQTAAFQALGGAPPSELPQGPVAPALQPSRTPTAMAPVAAPRPDTSSYARFLEGVQRRGGGTGGVWQGVGRGALRGAGAGAAYGGVGAIPGAVIGGIAGGIYGAATKHAKTAPDDISVQDATAVFERFFREELQREPRPGEIDGILRGQGWKPGDRWVGTAALPDIMARVKASEPTPPAVTGAGGIPVSTASPTLGGMPYNGDTTFPTPYEQGGVVGPKAFEGAVAPAGAPAFGTPATGSTVRAKDQFLSDAEAAYAAGVYGPEWVRAWVAAHPEWEIDDGADPSVRMRQAALDLIEPGQQTMWQDVIFDSGGANRPQFMNRDGGGGPSAALLGAHGALTPNAPAPELLAGGHAALGTNLPYGQALIEALIRQLGANGALPGYRF